MAIILKKMLTNINKTKGAGILILILFILGIVSCTSPLSSEKIVDISLIHAEIEITQNPVDKEDNCVIVDLSDKNGNRISNDSVTISVNGIEEKVTHRQGLYYNNESKYILSDVPVKDVYRVEIKLSDGKAYFLGSVPALAEEKIENIQCEDEGDLNADFVIKWHDLKDLDELSVKTSVLLKTSTEREKNYDYRPEIIKKIPGQGMYVFSKNDYADSTSILTGLEFDFRTTKKGTINPRLLKNSKITVTTFIEKNVNFEK